MIKLDNGSSAWMNYFAHLVRVYNQVPIFMTVEAVAGSLSNYNGECVETDSGWQPYFKTEQDLQWFLLKWS